ncbi:MAG: ImmA/IrrE family metallo-endopeptidase [Steroidobacteraceae bacterium]|nr:ImmA/IrrE family metallo-endopeptidase [Nevskiaceae bacterium]
MLIEKIEQEAERVLSELGITKVPTPVEDIALRLGMRISRAPSSDFSGLLLRKDGKALIGVNSQEPLVRQRFTIAHEIGHFLLHPQQDAFVDFRKSRNADEARPPRERQADMFAAALLMPRGPLLLDFRKLAKDGDTSRVIPVLATKYSVSAEAMRFRLINLNSLVR